MFTLTQLHEEGQPLRFSHVPLIGDELGLGPTAVGALVTVGTAADLLLFPVAGYGTRFLPATKSSPKEMLPVVNRPLIEYAVAEAFDAPADDGRFSRAGAAGNADDDRFAPALVRAFQRLTHHRGVADTFEGVVGTATGQFDKMADKIIAMVGRIDEMRHAEFLTPDFLVIVEIDTDDLARADHPQPRRVHLL